MNSAPAFSNPAWNAFVAAIKTEFVLAQVLIRRNETRFELRHAQDGNCAPESLRVISENEIRALTQFTESGAFRPLKSAPNLCTAWRLVSATEKSLEFALNTIYPGAVADWFAVNFRKAQPTHYRAFTSRQTGMYRITAMLTDAQAAPMIRACCHEKFCLKQRLWSVNDLAPDSPAEKSSIPCLEPCAILLEFSRKAMRLEQEPERQMNSGNEPREVREADFENPNNPRRLQLAVEKEAGQS